MRARAKDPELGALLRVDHPLPLWAGWSVIIVFGIALGGWALFARWMPLAMSLPAAAFGFLCSMYLLGERFLIEQRIHERALVSRSLIPFVGLYVIPYVAMDADTIRLAPRFNYRAPGETHLPFAASLRCLPWGPVLRVMAPSTRALKSLRRDDGRAVPRTANEINNFYAYEEEWVFSFRDLDQTAELLKSLIDAENDRVGAPMFDSRGMFTFDRTIDTA